MGHWPLLRRDLGSGELQLTAPRVITRAATGLTLLNMRCPPYTEGGTREEDPRRPERAAPVAAAARAAADRVSERAHVRRPDPSGEERPDTGEEMAERPCSAVGKRAGRVSPREGRQRRKSFQD